MLILDGHNSHHTIDFDNYCKDNNIIPLCMPAHSSHILQPLNVKYFGPLKASYNKEIKQMMRMQITHITKNNFFPAFKRAFYATINPKNIQANFKTTGLIPYNPKKMIGGLDFKLHTPTPSNSRPTNSTSTNPNTPRTAKNTVRNFINLKNKIAKHQSNSPTHLYKLVDTQAKSISKLTHKMMLLEAENKTLRTTNELLSKRKKTKKTHVRIE